MCKKKELGIHKAKDLYKSTLFKYTLKYAEFFKTDIYILSAKYGVLELNDYIKSYNVTLNNANIKFRKSWACKVIKQLGEKGVTDKDKVIFLCGEKYLEFISLYYKNNEIPLKNMGLGERLKFLKQEISRRKNERK